MMETTKPNNENTEESEPNLLSPKLEAVATSLVTEKKDKVEFVPDPEIIMENFDILAKKYRPLMWRHIRIIYQMHNKAVDVQDLEQEALMALFNSIEKFDKTRNIYFAVYLSKAIFNKLLCYCRNTLPHFWIKDLAQPGKFKRKKVYVESLDEPNKYNY